MKRLISQKALLMILCKKTFLFGFFEILQIPNVKKTIHFSCLCVLVLLISEQKAFSKYYLRDSQIPAIEEMTKNYKNKALDLRQLDELVRKISKNGSFQVVFVESISEDEVVIRTKSSKKVIDIQITGNVFCSDEEILKKINLKKDQVVSPLEISQSIVRIRKLYESSNFHKKVKINFSQKSNDKGYVLMIHIDEQNYYTVNDINIRSDNKRLNKKIKSRLLKFIGSSYKNTTTKDLKKRIQEELLKNRYLTSKVSYTPPALDSDKKQVNIHFDISKPTQFEFIFYGNQFFSHFDLIRESKIGNKIIHIGNTSVDIINNIRKLYLKSGFTKIDIQISEKSFPENYKRIFIFEIKEGPRFRIGKINIFGKISRKKSYYTKLFLQSLSEQGQSVYFFKENIQPAAQAMIAKLKRQGHFKARLTSINSQLKGNHNADIDLHIDEGVPTHVRQILFPGSKSFHNFELRKQVGIEPNQPIQIVDVEKSFDKLIQFYKKNAFLEFKINNMDSTVIQYEPGLSFADIVYHIKEGPKIKVKDITIKGAKRTKHYILFREINFKKGDYLTLEKVTSSIERLEQTGLFGKVNIHLLEQNTTKSERNVVIEVEERKPGLFSSGIGLLNEGRITYRGYVGTTYNNLWGKARGLSGRVDMRYQEGVNYLENRIALSYYEPFIFEDRVRGRVSLVREEELFDFRENDSDILSTNEVRLSLEKNFSSHFRLAYNLWRFSNQATFNVQDQGSRQTINIGSTGPTIELDYRNDPLLPTKGNYIRFDFEYSDPVFGSSRDNPNISGINPKTLRPLDADNEINYYKTSLSTTHYTPLTKSKRWVWVHSLRGGYLKNISSRSDSGIPKVRSFFLGGSSTIRGFSIGTTETIPGKRELCLKQNIINHAQNTDECGFDDIFVRDDSSFFLVKSELRFPLVGPLGGLFFYDGGAVYLGEFKLQDPYRDSVGFGLRYNTPVGSFIIELGYKLDRKLGGLETNYDRESDVALHLAIGNF